MCVLCVCFWKCVVIFILEHWGVRWREAAEEESLVEGGVIHLNLLVFHCPLSSFLFFLSFSFVEPLSEKAMFYTPPHTVHTVCI